MDSTKVYKKNEKLKNLKKKLRLKRQIIVVIWAVLFTYLNFSNAQNNESTTEINSIFETKSTSPNTEITLGILNTTTTNYDTTIGILNGTTRTNYVTTLGILNETTSSTGYTTELLELEISNCTKAAVDDFPNDIFTQKQRTGGGLVFHFLVSLYAFYILAVCCDEFFVPSIEKICDELHVSSDVAGASFMAIATSAPELFTNVIGTFITEGDIGIGTIVGSAVFNILAIAACCGLAAKNALQLEWYPLTRDCLFYLMSVILLVVLLGDNQIYWFESLGLICLYVIYLLTMWKNESFKKITEKIVYGIRGLICGPNSFEKYNDKRNGEKSPLLVVRQNLYGNLDGDGNKLSNNEEICMGKPVDKNVIEIDDDDEDNWSLFKFPWGENLFVWIQWFVTWPGRFVLTFTIPDCREFRFKNVYPITFIMCIVWIGACSYVVSWMMTIIGFTLAIPDSIMGLTFLAAGTSVPEAISSLIVVRKHGAGVLAISNSIGSNTFDILICLGLPWFIRGIIIMNDEFDYVKINSKGLEFSSMMLLASLILFYFILVANKFKLDKKVGAVCLLIYASFLVLSSLFELNIFFPVNLPTCPSIY